MVRDRITDGRRIAQLLASELEGRVDGDLEYVSVTNADREVEVTTAGARAYDVTRSTPDSGEETRLARVFVHEERARLEFDAGRKAALECAEDVGLHRDANSRSHPAVFVDSGAQVKRAVNVVQAASRALEAGDGKQ